MPNPNVLADITITQLQDTVIQNQNSEVELVQLVQEKIIVVDNSRQLRDNVRRNTFKNRNNNSDNNVVRKLFMQATCSDILIVHTERCGSRRATSHRPAPRRK